MTDIQTALSVLAATISCASILGGILISMVRKDSRLESKVDRIIDVLESEHTGQLGVLARVAKVELEQRDMREWMLEQGYERRKSGEEGRQHS